MFFCKVRRSLVVRSAGLIAHPVRVGVIWGISAKERPVALQSSWRRAKGSGLLSSAPLFIVTKRRRSSCFFPPFIDVEIRVRPFFSKGGGRGALVLQRSALEFLKVLAMSV